MKPILTVYCPSLSHRPFVDQASLVRMAKLPIEFLMLQDNDWRSTGMKTRQLIQMARADWVMGMGDDDFLHPSIFNHIMPIIQTNNTPDMIGFNIECLRDKGAQDLLCKVSPQFTRELETWDGPVQMRPYCMPCPIKRRLFDNIEWADDQSWGEDNEIAKQVVPLIHNWHYIDKTLYFARPLGVNPDRKEWSKRYAD